MKRERPDWLFMRWDLAFECRRCGDVQPMGRSPLLDFYLAASTAYLAIHRHCKPTAGDSTVNDLEEQVRISRGQGHHTWWTSRLETLEATIPMLEAWGENQPEERKVDADALSAALESLERLRVQAKARLGELAEFAPAAKKKTKR